MLIHLPYKRDTNSLFVTDCMYRTNPLYRYFDANFFLYKFEIWNRYKTMVPLCMKRRERWFYFWNLNLELNLIDRLFLMLILRNATVGNWLINWYLNGFAIRFYWIMEIDIEEIRISWLSHMKKLQKGVLNIFGHFNTKRHLVPN